VLRARPKGGRNAVAGVREDGALLVRVTPAAEQGKANAAIVQVLAAALELPRSALEIVVGESSADKVVLVVGGDAEVVRARLVAVLAGG
jgi:uncharacterized protein YggU (UPF0235/DUF167 family)